MPGGYGEKEDGEIEGHLYELEQSPFAGKSQSTNL